MSGCFRIISIVGARPNLPKIAPLIREMQRHPEIEPLLVHTGQHYDENLSNIFFSSDGHPRTTHDLELVPVLTQNKLRKSLSVLSPSSSNSSPISSWWLGRKFDDCRFLGGCQNGNPCGPRGSWPA